MNISNPMPVDQAIYHQPRSNTTSPPLVSPSRTPPRGHRPSLSKGMAWLSSRGSGSSGNANPTQFATASSKPIRISEPKFANTLEVLRAPRSGTLGSGATVVKTPQEALSAQYCDEAEGYDIKSESAVIEEFQEGEDDCRRLPRPPKSQELPPIPQDDFEDDGKSDLVPFEQFESMALPPPTRPPPALPPVASTSMTFHHTLKKESSSNSLDYMHPMPALPVQIATMAVSPPFDPILVGPAPTSAIDPSKIIVSLETGTSTHRTTLTTLTSRPSHLASYLKSLLVKADSDSDTMSVTSHMSEVPATHDNSFNSIFHQHLASSGLLSQASSNIHVFLDRPSAP